MFKLFVFQIYFDTFCVFFVLGYGLWAKLEEEGDESSKFVLVLGSWSEN